MVRKEITMPEIKKLVECSDLYYNEGKSTLTDEEYDKLREELKLKFPDDPYFTEVGSRVKNGEKVKLKYILGSLNKVKIDEIENWLEKQDSDVFVISEKLDGVSFYVNYKNGKVVSAATRGDGFYGKDITDKAKIFCGDIQSKENHWFRCEAMLVSEIHESLGFKTRRNGAAGIINRDDLKDVKHITPYFYELLNYSEVLNESTEVDRFSYINMVTSANQLKNHTPFYMIYDKKTHTKSDIINFLDRMKSIGAYDIDGLVITPMDYERQDILYPKTKVAFKMNEEPIPATVKNIIWGTTRTSRVVPLIEIEPVEIQGVTISKATGFNAKYIKDNQIGIGTVVKIIRSGDVIPYIVSIEESTQADMIDECPFCESKLIWEGVDLKCTNDDCWRKTYKELEHFLRSMGAENITEKTLMKLGISHIEMLYEIDEWAISTIDGFGVKRAQQIVDEIQGTLFTTPEILLRSFGMKNIGKTASKEITKHLYRITDDDNTLMEYIFSLPYEELIKIEGIGDVTATTFVSEIGNYRDKYEFLKRMGLTFMNENEAGKLDGVKFALTGKGFMGRKEIQTLIEREGGSVSGLSKTTKFLVKDPDSAKGSKYKKAMQYGVTVVSYDDLKGWLGV